MSEAPRLFTHKPKKAQIKQVQGIAENGFSPPPSVPPTPPTPTPVAPVKESFARRYKFLWPLLLTVNLTVGAYVFMRTKRKDTSSEGETVIPAAGATNNSSPTEVPVAENAALLDAASHPAPSQVSAVAVPITASPVTTTHQSTVILPEEQQRELFKWILDEKRRIKPKDTEEKKHIDAEKAVLKQYIRAKSIPSI